MLSLDPKLFGRGKRNILLCSEARTECRLLSLGLLGIVGRSRVVGLRASWEKRPGGKTPKKQLTRSWLALNAT